MENQTHGTSAHAWERLLADRFVPGQVVLDDAGPGGRLEQHAKFNRMWLAQLSVRPQSITHAVPDLGTLSAEVRASLVAHVVVEGDGFIEQNGTRLPFGAGTSRSATSPNRHASCSRRPAVSTPYGCRQRPCASIVQTTRGTAPLRRGSRAAPICQLRPSAGSSPAWPWMAPAVPPISTYPLPFRGCSQPPITVIQRQRPPSEPEMNCAGNRRSTTWNSICTTRTICPQWPARKRSACQNATCTDCLPNEVCASPGSSWPSASRPRKRCCTARPTVSSHRLHRLSMRLQGSSTFQQAIQGALRRLAAELPNEKSGSSAASWG